MAAASSSHDEMWGLPTSKAPKKKVRFRLNGRGRRGGNSVRPRAGCMTFKSTPRKCKICGARGTKLVSCDWCPMSLHPSCVESVEAYIVSKDGHLLCNQCQKCGPTHFYSSTDDDDVAETECNEVAEMNGDDDHHNNKKATGRMADLYKSAVLLDPKQFKMAADRRKLFRDVNSIRTINLTPSASTDEQQAPNAEIPFMPKKCHSCKEDCKVAPLVQCDYCPRLFHQDCVYPPMEQLPQNRWMCPMHPKHFSNLALVNSISPVEKCAEVEKPPYKLDYHAFRTDFIRRSASHLPHRIPPPKLPRDKMPIPQPIYDYYKKILSSSKCNDNSQLQNEIMETCNSVDHSNMDTKNNDLMYNDSQENGIEDNIKNVICLNMECSHFLSKNANCIHHKYITNDESVEENELEDNSKITNNILNKVKTDDDNENDSTCEDTVDTQNNKPYLIISPKLKKSQNISDKKELKDKFVKLKDSATISELLTDPKLAKAVSTIESKLDSLDFRVIKLLAYIKLQQLVPVNGLDKLNDVLSPLLHMIVNSKVIPLSALDNIRMPNEFYDKNFRQRVSKLISDSLISYEDIYKLCELTPRSYDELPLYAIIYPVERPAENGLGDGLGQGIIMRSSSFKVGTSGCDLSLEEYGKCSCISDLHSIIFYDETTKVFELINYSEFGTIVNGQLYSCDFSGSSLNERNENTNETSKMVDCENENEQKFLTVHLKDPQCRCNKIQKRSVRAWEGSAILKHGTVLQFGCLMFVFCVPNQVTKK